MEISKKYVLLRLKPGPAEAYFGITMAPMSVIADWHGRVLVPYLVLRGDIDSACKRLETEYKKFDFKKAKIPPAKIPKWASDIVELDHVKEMEKLLEEIHPRRGRSRSRIKFKQLIAVYESLEIEGQIISFCTNYITSLEKRLPPKGEVYRGYLDECKLLEKMSFANNDSIKFMAIAGWGKFAPVGKIAFLVERIEKKRFNARNYNVVFCRCLSAIGVVASRYILDDSKKSQAEFQEIRKTLPTLRETLDNEGRNNSACMLASNSVKTIIKATGNPEALEVFIHNLNVKKSSNARMQKMTDGYVERAKKELTELVGLIGQKYCTDFASWIAWYKQNEKQLYFDFNSKRFVLDAKKAKKYRRKFKLK